MNPLRTIGAKVSSLTFDEGLEYEFSESQIREATVF